jgi:hypothetical protein
MTNRKTHPHAMFIMDWLHDTSSEIETRDPDNGDCCAWQKVPINFVFHDRQGEFEFRFASKHNVMSSLTDDELYAIADAENVSEDGINCSVNRAIANAAAQRAIDDLELPHNWLDQSYRKSPHFYTAGQVITKYLKDLKSGQI